MSILNTFFVTSVDSHSSVKTEILDIVKSTVLSDDHFTAVDLPITNVREYYADCIERFEAYLKENGIDECVFDPDMMWINVYKNGQSVAAHSHPDYYYYAVHQLQVDGAGGLTEFSEDGETWITPSANEGDIIFFPGHLKHRSQANSSDSLRIIVGINANSVYRKQELLEELRAERNKRLSETDWWALSDVILTTERAAYRQALRDITTKYISLKNVVWPVKPA